jgi:hypothetical protein
MCMMTLCVCLYVNVSSEVLGPFTDNNKERFRKDYKPKSQFIKPRFIMKKT